MATTPLNGYLDYKGIESGKNGTIKGLIAMDSPAEAFRYQKVIQVTVDGALDDRDGVPVTGNWRVRIRDDESVDSDGNYTGAILFDQELMWSASISVIELAPGLNWIEWSPDGPSGGGKQQTRICNGEECAVVENIYAPEPGELEAYAETGAWRFLDQTVDTDEDGSTKYEIERGYAYPDHESLVTNEGATFYATWYSQNYRCDFPEGSIFEIVKDEWQVGRLDKEADFRVSIKAGVVAETALVDTRTGSRWQLFPEKSGGKTRLKVLRDRKRQSPLETAQTQFATAEGVVEENSKLAGLHLMRLSGGALAVLGGLKGPPKMVRVFLSTDEGQHWERVMNAELKLTPLASCAVHSGAQILIYGIDASKAPAYAVLGYGKVSDGVVQRDGWRVLEEGTPTGSAVFPLKGAVELQPGDGGAVRLLWRDAATKLLYTLISRDGGKTFSAEANA